MLTFHLGYVKSPIFKRKQVNPLSLSVTIPSTYPQTPSSSSRLSDPRDKVLRDTIPAYTVVGKYLLERLSIEVEHNTHPKIFNDYESYEDILAAFRQQFLAYTCQDSIFINHDNLEPRNYWSRLLNNSNASVLAVRPLIRFRFYNILISYYGSYLASSCIPLSRIRWLRSEQSRTLRKSTLTTAHHRNRVQ